MTVTLTVRFMKSNWLTEFREMTAVYRTTQAHKHGKNAKTF